MTRDVFVAGVGMIAFAKPGKSDPYHVMASRAAAAALADAGLGYERIQQAYVGYVYGDSTAGQRALYEVGMSGIPIVNVNNNCSTGSTALFLARQAVASGAVDCALALGFEQMNPGALGSVFHDRPSPFDRFDAATQELVGHGEIPLALRYFGGAGQAHMQQYGTRLETFAKIRAKASRHAANNPLALFRQEVSVDDVMNAQMIWPGVMTRLMEGQRVSITSLLMIADDLVDMLRRGPQWFAAPALGAHGIEVDLNRDDDRIRLRLSGPAVPELMPETTRGITALPRIMLRPILVQSGPFGL